MQSRKSAYLTLLKLNYPQDPRGNTTPLPQILKSVALQVLYINWLRSVHPLCLQTSNSGLETVHVFIEKKLWLCGHTQSNPCCSKINWTMRGWIKEQKERLPTVCFLYWPVREGIFGTIGVGHILKEVKHLQPTFKNLCLEWKEGELATLIGHNYIHSA